MIISLTRSTYSVPNSHFLLDCSLSSDILTKPVLLQDEMLQLKLASF